jgi:hypothetical protein
MEKVKNWSDPTELSPAFLRNYIIALEGEDDPEFNTEIINILHMWGSNTDNWRAEKIVCIGDVSLAKLQKHGEECILPHKDVTFRKEVWRLAQLISSLPSTYVVHPNNSPTPKRNWRWLVWLTVGIVVGAVGCAVFQNLVNNQDLEQQAIDLNKLRPEEVAQLDSYLVQYRPQIEALGRHYFPLIQRVHADAQSRLRIKGRDMAFFLATPEMVFAEVVAIQFWNHDANELRSQAELDAYFGTYGALRVPTDHIEEVQYVRLYHPDFLIEYDRKNNLGVGFGAGYDIANVSPGEMLLVSLMYLSDNPGRPPVASSVVNVIEHVYETLKTW